jgi:hypothetical protein
MDSTMSRVVTVRPASGRVIFMPDLNFQPVPTEGAQVHLDMFYSRAIAHGDLVIVDTPVAPVVAAEEPSAPVAQPKSKK